MSQSIASFITQTLEQAGVKRIWGVTGDSLNGISDSLRKMGTIEWLGTRHEESAAFAAGAEAHISGELAVCAGSCGPGNLHLINGLFDCHRNKVPVLAIAAHIPSSEIGSNYFQETHPQELFKECSVFCELVSSPEQMPYLLETAMRQAILHNDVSVLVLPGDIALKAMPETTKQKWNVPKPATYNPALADIEAMATHLNNSRKVTLLCGAGCKDSHDEIIALAAKLQAPIVHAMRGKEFLEYDNPYDVGMTGFIGFSSGYHAMQQADTLLMIGTSFPYRAFYPENSIILQIDNQPASLGRHVQIDCGVLGDTKNTVTTLLKQITGERSSAHLNQCVKNYGRRRLIGSFNHGSMANALSQAMGAQSIDRSRQVIAMCGDGGFSMLMGDLLSLKQLNLPIKIVVFNNRSLSFVAMEMKAAGFLSSDTDLDNPSFAKIAQACGLKGIHVDDPEKLPDAITEMMTHSGPVVLEVDTAKQELVMPPEIKLEQAKGFSVYMMKALINGKGNEIIELSKTNWLR